MSAASSDATQSGLIYRVLGPKRQEYVAAAWSFVLFFCILSAYYSLRSVRETMAVEGGIQNIPWLFSGTFTVMLFAAPIFGWIASRFPRRRFLPWVYGFFVINILLFWAGFSWAIANEQDYVWTGRAFFVWLSVFNLFVVSVFWSFMADIWSKEQGRRLFGFISAGGSIGAMLGPLATGMLVVPLGFRNILPMAAMLLVFAAIGVIQLRRWVESEHVDDRQLTVASTKPLGGSPLAGISHVMQSKYLGGIVLQSVIASLMGTALYVFMAQLVGEAYPDVDERTRFFALVDSATNALSFAGQLLIVRHVVRRWGIGTSLSFLPIVSLVGFILLAINPVLATVAALQVVRRSLGFGFSKPTTDMLYSVVTPEEKYKAKNFVDTAVYRGGDLIGIWAVRLMAPLGIIGISLVMVPFAILWFLNAKFLGRSYVRRDKTGIRNATP